MFFVVEEIDSFLGQNLNNTAQAVENSGQQFTVPTYDQSAPQNNYFIPEHGNGSVSIAQHSGKQNRCCYHNVL